MPAALAQQSQSKATSSTSSSPPGGARASSARASSAATVTAPPNGGPAGACVTVTETSSSSCAGANCCAVRQRVTLCPKHTTALAEINGNVGSCCVVLLNKKHNYAYNLFCSTPVKTQGAHMFPPGVSVTLNPDCSATPAGPAGALSCSATFARLPKGFILPKASQTTLKAGAAPWGTALPPCGNSAYGRFTQTAAVDPVTGAATITTQCL